MGAEVIIVAVFVVVKIIIVVIVATVAKTKTLFASAGCKAHLNNLNPSHEISRGIGAITDATIFCAQAHSTKQNS